MKLSIVIIGHFGGNETFNDGQTIKTITIYNALKKIDNEKVKKIDTYYIKKNPLKFCFSLLTETIRNKKYIVLLSEKGRKVLFPILSFMSKYVNKEIFHYAIGGRLADEVLKSKKMKKYVQSFSSNWVESKKLAKQLQELGVENTIYIPNFKKISIVDESKLCQEYCEPYRLCTFSRVMEEKGIGDAIVAVRNINTEANREVVTLDIYAPVEKKYKEEFYAMLQKGKSCRYCGVVSASESVEILKDYYLLLFPTKWKAEGMPGTIIDALSAGLPSIVKRWEYSDEMIENNITGYVYDKPEQLKEVILYAIKHVPEVLEMKYACINKAKEYGEEYIMKEIKKQLGISQ